jgi:hypothetical protein
MVVVVLARVLLFLIFLFFPCLVILILIVVASIWDENEYKYYPDCFVSHKYLDPDKQSHSGHPFWTTKRVVPESVVSSKV